MNCRDFNKLLDRHIDGELASAEAGAVESHAQACSRCAEKLRLARVESKLLRDALLADAPAPAISAQALWARVHRFAVIRNWSMRAAAAAAALVLIFLAGTLFRRDEGAPLARIITCSGPLEIKTRGDWRPLATYTTLRHSNSLRCGEELPGGIILNAGRRLDLDSLAEVQVLAERDKPGWFALNVLRGRIHCEFVHDHNTLTITTPLGTLVASGETTGRSEFEIYLSNPEETAFSLMPAAHAAEPQYLEVSVYDGAVKIEGEKIYAGNATIISAGATLRPRPFNVASRVEWWPLPESKFARLHEPRPEPIDDRDPAQIFEPAQVPVTAALQPPDTKPRELPPPPSGVSAHPDIDGVIITWEPAVGSNRTVNEYCIYRRGAGDTDFALVARFPVAAQKIDRYMFQHEDKNAGTSQFAVSALYEEKAGLPQESAVSSTVSASPFSLRYVQMRDVDSAELTVERYHEGAVRRQTFVVHKRNFAAGETGEIGGMRQVLVANGDRTSAAIDFTTGYYLIDIADDTLIIENDLGLRREIKRLPQ